MPAESLSRDDVEKLHRLCQWNDKGHQAQGVHLLETLVGEQRGAVDLEAICARAPADRSEVDQLWALYGLAEALGEERPDEERCLRLALATAPDPTLTYQLLTGRFFWRAVCTLPDYDLRWMLVNLGLHRAYAAADPRLFSELLEGVSVHEGREIRIHRDRCVWARKDRFDILDQHLARGLMGLAPPECEAAVALREAMTELKIDAEEDQYKWERDMPVDALPLSFFPALTSLHVRNAAPLVNGRALMGLENLQETHFEGCHLPWEDKVTWSPEAVRRASLGDEEGLRVELVRFNAEDSAWKKSSYIHLDTGEMERVVCYGTSVGGVGWQSTQPQPQDLSLLGPEATFISWMLSPERDERLKALQWVRERPQEVADFEAVGINGEGSALDLPNCRLWKSEMTEEALQILFAMGKSPRDFSLAQNAQVETLGFLTGSSSLRSLELERCERLSDLSALPGFRELRSLKLEGLTALRNLSALSGCAGLKHLHLSGLKVAEGLESVSALRELGHLQLSLMDGPEDLECLRGLSCLERLKIHFPRGLKGLRGLEGAGAASGAPGKPDLVVDLWNCPDLQALDAMATGVLNLHLRLRGCPEVRNLDGLREHPSLEKLLLVLEGCDALEDLSALNHIPNLRKLHLNVAGIPQGETLLECLALPDDVQVVVVRKTQDYEHF